MHLCDPKTGRKLPLGKKCTPVVIIMSQEDGQKMHKNPTPGDLGILLMVSHGISCFQNPILASFYFNSSLQDCSEQGI